MPSYTPSMHPLSASNHPLQHHNPFNFKHVTHLKSASHFDDVGPCVMMATPSGLQVGATSSMCLPANSVYACVLCVMLVHAWTSEP